MEASRPSGLGFVPCSRTKVRATSPHSLLGAGGREQTVADGQSLERPVTAGPGGGVLGFIPHPWSSGHLGVPEVEVPPAGREVLSCSLQHPGSSICRVGAQHAPLLRWP